LLTAHHADDQLETVLLALLRGSGVKGLAAMPASSPFGAGWHLRPLLKFAQADLQRWAAQRNLAWIDDPSNAELHFSRNYLRAQVLPPLRARWPSASSAVTRSAAHMGEAAGLLDELAAIDHDAAAVTDCIDVRMLRGLSGPRRRNLLRYWIRKRGLPLPSTAKLRSLEHDALTAERDRSLWVHWPGAEVRGHRDLLYANAPLPAPSFAALPLSWNWEHEPLPLGSGMGELRAQRTRGRGLGLRHLQPTLRVRRRYDGERLRVAGRPHERSLKHLLQESAVLPWWRVRLPLICVSQALAAVADLYVTQNFAALPGEDAVEIVWLGRPAMTATSVS
jgi:tRNA(Ile)-lysidine synthase